MTRLLGWIAAGGVLLACAAPAAAQVSVTFGSPYSGSYYRGWSGYSYPTYGYGYGYPGYRYGSAYSGYSYPTYSYGPQYSYSYPSTTYTTYSSGYRGYATPYYAPSYGYSPYGVAPSYGSGGFTQGFARGAVAGATGQPAWTYPAWGSGNFGNAAGAYAGYRMFGR